MKRSLWVAAACLVGLGTMVLVPAQLSAAEAKRGWDCGTICPGGNCTARGWNCTCHCDGIYPHCFCTIAF